MTVMTLEDRADQIGADSATPVTVRVAADLEARHRRGKARARHPAAQRSRAGRTVWSGTGHRPPGHRVAARPGQGRHRPRPRQLRHPTAPRLTGTFADHPRRSDHCGVADGPPDRISGQSSDPPLPGHWEPSIGSFPPGVVIRSGFEDIRGGPDLGFGRLQDRVAARSWPQRERPPGHRNQGAGERGSSRSAGPPVAQRRYGARRPDR